MTTTLHNHSAPALADLIGELDAQTKAIEKRIREAKAELEARGLERAEGERFNVQRSSTVRWTLDTAAAKEALGESWVTAHSKITPVTTWRTTVIRASLVGG